MTPAFRKSAHWLLYAETLAGSDGLPSESPRYSRDMTPEERRAVTDAWQQGQAIREVLFPEDVTDG